MTQLKFYNETTGEWDILQGGPAKAHVGATAPENPYVGQMWMDTGQDPSYLMTWNVITGLTINMAPMNGYLMDNALMVTGVLPAICAVGQIIRVVGKGAGKWKITQNAGQQIHFNTVNTTAGVNGYIMAINRYDTIELLCTAENTEFTVIGSSGTLEVV